MRPDLELIEKIEDFLNGRLSSADMAAFRKQIAADADLREKVQLQEEVMKGIERASLTQRVKSAGRIFHYSNSFKKWGWGGGVAVVVVTASILLFNYWKNNSHTKYEGSLSLYNESGSKEWSDADRKIAPQIFTINGARDTVIESKGGIVFSIPANGFLDSDGKPVTGQIRLNVKDALDAATIMKSGLSTKSGDRLLETGGMFYIDARTDEDILKIDPAKGIYAGVPSDTIKPGMQLFQGKRMADGSIDWVDPKPISHDLTQVNIESLNFYPPFYLDSIKRWGYDATNKKFTDSLYYSFAARFGIPERDIDGKAIFQSKCASCHAIERDMTGPKLQGVIDRWGGNMYQIRAWVRNYAKAVAAGYPRAIEIMNYSASNHTTFDSALTDAEIDAVINYVNGSETTVLAPVDAANGQSHHADSIVSLDNRFSTCGINPAKIKAIWSKDFQNTFIATREFEERLALIHETKDPALLDLYISNLDKNLYELDSIATKLLGERTGMHEDRFLTFAARRDGNVKNNSPQFQKLCEYYRSKTKAYTDVITKTQNEFWDKQRQLDEIYFQRKGQNQADSFDRIAKNFDEEFTLNLKDAYRQLGYDTNFKNNIVVQPAAEPMYNVVVTNTGWNNVDKYVFDATENREDMTYTDPQTGKTATLKYTPVEFNIVNSGQYDHVYIYLLPEKLNSYMRVNGSNGKFSEKLNDLMGYDLVCIAYKGEQPFYYSRKDIKTGTYTVELKAISQSQLERELKLAGPSTKTGDIQKEIDFLLYENKDRIRQQNNQSLFELVHKIEPFILCRGQDTLAMEYIGPEPVRAK